MTSLQAKRLEELKRRYMAEGYKMAMRNKKFVKEGYSDEDYAKNKKDKEKVRSMLNDMYNNIDFAIETYDYDYNPSQVKLLKQLKNFLKKNISHF